MSLVSLLPLNRGSAPQGHVGHLTWTLRNPQVSPVSFHTHTLPVRQVQLVLRHSSAAAHWYEEEPSVCPVSEHLRISPPWRCRC